MSSRTLRITYTGDARGALGALKTIEQAHAAFGDKLRVVGQRMRSAGRSLTTGVTLPIVGFGVAAVKAFSESQNAIAQTEAVIKSTGGSANVTGREVGKLSTQIMNYSGISDETVRSGQNLLLTFTNIRNEVGKGNDIFTKATKTITDLSVGMGQDMKTSAIQVGKALNDPIAGLTSLSRIGVTFSEQQKTLIARLVESGDVLGAQKVILAELNKEFGGSAKAAGETAAGAFAIAREKIGNAMEQIGGVIVKVGLPIFQQLIGYVQRALSAFNELDPGIKRIIVIIAAAVAAAGPLLWVLGAIVTGIGVLLSPIGLAIAALVALGVGFALAWNRSEEFRDGVRGAIAAVQGVIEAFVAAVKKFWSEWGESITDTVTKVREVISGFVAGVSALWDRFGGVIMDQVRVVWSFFATQVKAAFEIVKGIIDVALGILTLDWRQAWQGLKEIFAGVWDTIENIVRSAFGTLKNVVRAGLGVVAEIWKGIWDKIKDTVLAVVHAVLGFIDSLIGRIRDAIAFLKDLVTLSGNAQPAGSFKGQVPSRFGTPPSGQFGGFVERTGLAKIHRGEWLSGVGNGRMGAPIYATINVNGASDPAETARKVRDELLKIGAQGGPIFGGRA